MSLTVERLTIALIVAGALFFVARRFWRAVRSARLKRAGGGGCDSGCGCDTGAGASPRDWAER